MSKDKSSKKVRNKILHIFFMGLLRSFLIVFSIVAVAVGSYVATRYYYAKHSEELLADEDTLKDIIEDAKVEDISKNLIYVYDTEKSMIRYCVVEIFNTKKNTMDYVTIPAKSKITISADLYQRLSTVVPEVPQTLKIARMNQYFEEGEGYDYGVLLLEDYFGIDISYYTVVEWDKFKECFNVPLRKISYTRKVNVVATATPDITGVVPDTSKQKISSTVRVAELKPEFITQVSAYSTETELTEFLQEQYKSIESNLDIVGKIKYIQKYLALTPENIRYDCIPGEEVENSYEPDRKKCKKLFKSLDTSVAEATKAPVSEISEDTAPEIEMSTGKGIVVLNGTGAPGLAGQYQDLLTADGYTVIAVGNSTDGIHEYTQIQVNREGVGQDLLSYFNNASIEVMQLPQGTDIQIVVGTADQNIQQ